jgi:nucleotide-binding universal stress UspA family protein
MAKVEELVEEFKKEKGLNKDIKLIKEIKEGSPADIILKTVEDEGVDLIVMGTSGKHGLDRFLLGSVTEKVVRSANCPVLAVH